jgi:hypothetical protein
MVPILYRRRRPGSIKKHRVWWRRGASRQLTDRRRGRVNVGGETRVVVQQKAGGKCGAAEADETFTVQRQMGEGQAGPGGA